MKTILLCSVLLLVACNKPAARPNTEQKRDSLPEIMVAARKAVDEGRDGTGEMLAQLFLNAVKPGMTQDEALHALGTSKWVENCAITPLRHGPVPIRTLKGDGDRREQISVLYLSFYARDGNDRERWGAWIGLSNFTGGTTAAKQFFLGDNKSLAGVHIDELAIIHISKDGRTASYVTKCEDGGLQFGKY
jgi:hypothetical protein